MNIRLPFGFEIRNQKNSEASFVAPTNNDGAQEQVTSGAGFYGYSFSANDIPKSEVELINRYLGMQNIPEVGAAIEEITTEAIVQDFGQPIVRIEFEDDSDDNIPPNVQDIISQEFDNVLTLLNFEENAYVIFRDWYVTGRDYRHIVVDETALAEGIKDIRYIDPRKMKKVREVKKEKNSGGVEIITGIDEYFVFNDSGIHSSTAGIKLSVDTVAYTPSGLVDPNGVVISYLHDSIKPANMVRLMEDATVITKLVRAPERRLFYIDIEGMTKTKAEQYMNDVMNKYRNKVTFNPTTGEVSSDTQNYSILEDFWLPRRSNGKSTEISTLPGAQPQSMEEVAYYLDKLYKSLHVPLGRLQPDQGFQLGRTDQISREEVKFGKFIDRLRLQFSHMFNQLLRVQLVLKGIIPPEDWQYVKSKIQYRFARDNYFSELKENEILQQRLEMLETITPFVGKYFTEEYVMDKILRLSDKQKEDSEMLIRQAELLNKNNQGQENDN